MTVGVERHTSVEAVADEWDALADRVGVAPFLRPGWIGAWWDAFGSGTLEVLALRDGDRLTAVLPVVQRAGGVQSPTNWHTPEWGITAESSAAARTVADALFARRPAYTRLRFLGPGLAELRDAADAAGYTASDRPLQASPFLPLAGGWESLKRPREKQVARAIAKLEAALGAVTFELDETIGSLAEGLRIEGSGWKTEQGTAILSRPETERFYTEMARWAAGRGILRLFVLRAGSRAVAFEIGLEDCRRYYLVKGGYDPEFRKMSPGALMRRHLIRWCIDRGLESFEFLGAPEPTKLEWTDERRDFRALEAFSPRPLGVAARLAFVQGRPLAKRVRRAVVRGASRAG